MREEIVHADGSRTEPSLHAAFDGRDYEVTGSPVVDTIAYVRHDAHTITGVGKKGGEVSLRETASVSPDGATLTLLYAILFGGREVRQGTAVFLRVA